MAMTKALFLGGVIVVAGLLAFDASAQRFDDGGYRPYPDYADGQYRSGQSDTGVQYDYARVVRVDPIIVDGYSTNRQRCYDRADGDYVHDDHGFRDDGYYRDDPYYRGESRGGSETGRQVAMVVGGLAGAVLGSKVGGGDARYIGSAVGGLIGGAAGRSIYEASTRDTYRRSNVRVCEPVGYPQQYGGESERVDGYNVTYEYGGRTYQTRRDYHPGERIRVRVTVSPD